MSITRFPNLIVLAALLAGCSEMQHYSSDLAPVIEGGYGVNSWLGDVHKTRTMSPELLQQTLDDWELEFRDNPSLSNRMRLVLVITSYSIHYTKLYEPVTGCRGIGLRARSSGPGGHGCRPAGQ